MTGEYQRAQRYPAKLVLIGESSLRESSSPNASDVNEELKKLELAVKYGADTVMDLSTGGVNLDEVRTAIINASPVPIQG